MYGPRDLVLLLVGAQLFHTLSHLLLGVFVTLPLQLKVPRMVITGRLNALITAVNALVAAALVWWAGQL
jgi:hypothetical protein